jgi:hypothetical protein
LRVLLNGAETGAGFLIAPMNGQTFQGFLTVTPEPGETGELRLSTAADSAVDVNFDTTGVNLAAGPVAIAVSISSSGALRNDTVIELLRGAAATRFQLSAIKKPTLRFAGRFQCRLATDSDRFDSPFGEGNSSFGSYAVSGPDIANPDEPPFDRIIRLADPVGLRPFAEFSPTLVTAIEANLGGPESFGVGDAVLGMPVGIGAQARFESQDGAFALAGFEPISGFELRIGDRFVGGSAPPLPRNGTDPAPSTAPYANGLFPLDAAGPGRPGDFGYPEATWRVHAQAVTQAKIQALTAQVAATPAEQRIRSRRLQEHQNNLRGIIGAMTAIESYSGIIDVGVSVTPEDSPMLAYLQACGSYAFRGDFFNFDTDTHCGTVSGLIAERGLGNRNLVEEMVGRRLQVPRELQSN